MKNKFKKISLLFIATTFVGAMKINAATIKIKLEDGTKKEYEIKESEYNLTLKDFKESIAKDININAAYQVFMNNESNFPESDQLILKEYFASEYNPSVTELSYNVYKRKELDNTITLNSIPPTKGDISSASLIFEESIIRTYYGYAPDLNRCNSDYSKCMIKNASTNEDYKEVNIKYNYDKAEKENIDKIIKKVAEKSDQNNEITFSLKDLEIINYWLYGGSIINYSDEYKALINYKNFYIDIRCGNDNPFINEAYGVGYYKYDNTLYHVIPFIGVKTNNILYVPEETPNENIMETLQDRIDTYIGKGKIIIQDSNKTLDEVGYYFSAEEIEEFNSASADGKVYIAKINQKDYMFVISKNNAKMYSPKLITSDYKTDITISSNSGIIPLDTMIKANNITVGQEYERIMNLLKLNMGEMFDLKLFSQAEKSYINKLENGSFEVKIPLREEYKGKKLIAYYVDNDGKITEYKVTEKDGYATFNADHFSIYTIAVSSSQETIKNPQTSDTSILISIIVFLSSLSSILYLKKKLN